MNTTKRLGAALMALGAALVCGALGLFLYNQRQDVQAGEASQQVLPQLTAHIQAVTQLETAPEPTAVYDAEMTEVVLDGYAYIGYLSIPTLGLDLPVLSQWDYDRLQIAPCRYAGSTKSRDLVLCAHNYAKHFGNLKNLIPGDTVYFTDMDGVVTTYVVASVDILEPTAVEAMTDGAYPLTLFTCTYGGGSRVAVRCQSAA